MAGNLFTNMTFVLILIVTSYLHESVCEERAAYKCLKSQHNQPCVKGYCCCNPLRHTAVCDGSMYKLSYIPALPGGTKSLKFSNNILSFLNRTVFQNITDLILEELDIDGNQVEYVTKDAFSDLHHLKILHIKRNKDINRTQLFSAIRSINKVQLKSLDLTDMGIQGQIPRELLDIYADSSMTDITLDYNNITYIDMEDFATVTKLKYFRTYGNALMEFRADDVHPSLQRLVLTNNQLTRYPPKFCASNKNKFPRLQYLYLDYNFISVITPEHFNCLNKLTRLVLSGNILRNIPNNVIANLTSLTDFRVSHMLGLQGQVTTIDTHALNSSSLKRLEIDSNNIIFSVQYVENNIFESCNQLFYLSMLGNNLKYIHGEELSKLFSPLVKLERLYLDANHLTAIPTGMRNLKFLSLAGNSIRNLDSKSLLGFPNLRNLYLNGNNIRVLKPESFPEKVRKTLRILNLSQNPFACTCDNLWFRNWIGDTGHPMGSNIKLLNWPKGYTCSTPPEREHSELRLYRPTAVSCREPSLLVIISVSIGSISAFTSLCVLLGVRYRWYVMYWWYRMKQLTKNRGPEQTRLLSETRDQPYTYVIYHDEDRTFVHSTLLNTVEQQLGLKLYIWHRDSANGSKANIMFDAIESSENVLAIISNNFVKDGWCEFQLELGLSKKNANRNDSLTLLLLEDLEFSLLRRSWCVTLVKNATITWNPDTQTVPGRLCYNRLKTRLSSAMDTA